MISAARDLWPPANSIVRAINSFSTSSKVEPSRTVKPSVGPSREESSFGRSPADSIGDLDMITVRSIVLPTMPASKSARTHPQMTWRRAQGV
jgi:hypothetical protein